VKFPLSWTVRPRPERPTTAGIHAASGGDCSLVVIPIGVDDQRATSSGAGELKR
jgi:hypothetical protein